MSSSRLAQTAFDILPLLSKRWSPRVFSNQKVSREVLGSLFEAARWSPSCFNDQPWKFIITESGSEGFNKIVDAMVPLNQAWAPKAPVLVLSLANPHFRFNAEHNRFAEFDVGQSVAMLTIQASSMGLMLHQMSGYSAEKISASFGLAEKKLTPLSLVALGYPLPPDQPNTLPDALKEKELEPRSRVTLDDIITYQ